MQTLPNRSASSGSSGPSRAHSAPYPACFGLPKRRVREANARTRDNERRNADDAKVMNELRQQPRASPPDAPPQRGTLAKHAWPNKAQPAPHGPAPRVPTASAPATTTATTVATSGPAVSVPAASGPASAGLVTQKAAPLGLSERPLTKPCSERARLALKARPRPAPLLLAPFGAVPLRRHKSSGPPSAKMRPQETLRQPPGTPEPLKLSLRSRFRGPPSARPSRARP